MDQSHNHHQPRNTHRRVKEPRHKPTSRHQTPINEQQGLDMATALTRTHVPEAQPTHPHATFPAESSLHGNTMFQNAQGVNISGNPNFHNIHNVGSVTNVYGGGKDGLEYLNGAVSFDAQFDSSAQDPDRQCHPGTRQNVLKRLRDWVDDPKANERIFWLYGPAGAGKSAIARTIARSYARPKVSATFFFFRSDVNRNNGNRLFTTLAYQLALSMPEIKEYIAHVLSERPDLPTTDVETQFTELFLRPFHMLNEDSMQQFAPAVSSIIGIIEKYQAIAPVIVIDGVDECIDEKLQQRFLNVIDDAVKNDHFPLRFFIVSRPEVHIVQTIRRFQASILTTDLASLDDANRDIEKFLVDKFSRIASEQGLDPAWPGRDVIHEIVYKSSGNFIYAAVVIRFVGDPYCFAKTQLEIVLKLKPQKTTSPFEILDQLFLEILGRVPDQVFLKRYLALLVSRISASRNHEGLSIDDAILMHVSEQELHANLRRMRSLLKFKPIIDVHHRSILDFLYDPTRSGHYHIREGGGIRGYLEVFVDSLVRYVSTVIEQPDHNDIPHFTPKFRDKLGWYPSTIVLPAEEWQVVMRPLLDLLDKLLQQPNLASPYYSLRCDECTVIYLLRELMHLALYQGFKPSVTSAKEAMSVKALQKRRGVIFTVAPLIEKDLEGYDLDSTLLSLFAHLPEITENWSPNEDVINLTSAVLCFDCVETASKVRSVSDAQKLVDLVDRVIRMKNVLHPDAEHKARSLALQIFSRIPVLPMSHYWDGNDKPGNYTVAVGNVLEILSQTIFANRILDGQYMVPMLVKDGDNHVPTTRAHESTMYQWRSRLTPSSMVTIQIMQQLAKAIQYLHSIDIVLYRKFRSHDVVLEKDLCPKFRHLCSTSRFLLDKASRELFSPEENISSLGCLFYELYTGVDLSPNRLTNSDTHVTAERPTDVETTIPEYAWQLIQRCCAEDPKNRPTIHEVVHEMEGWNIQEEPERVVDEMNLDDTCLGALCLVLSEIRRKWFKSPVYQS